MIIKRKLPRFLIIAVSSIVILVLYKQVYLIVAPFNLQRTLASFMMHLYACPLLLFYSYCIGLKTFSISLDLTETL